MGYQQAITAAAYTGQPGALLFISDPINAPGGLALCVAASVGYTPITAVHGTPDELITAADQAMYQEKTRKRLSP